MQQIENGVHDLSNHDYHASAGLSRSALWEFKKSPFHYWNRYVNPERKPSFTTPAMKLGELVHTLVLEPETYESRFAVKPDIIQPPACGLLKDLGREEFDRQKNARQDVINNNIEMMDIFHSESRGKELVSADMHYEATLYANSVLKNKVAQALFKNVRVEQSIYFTHKDTGLQCKVRPDAWCGGVVTDLKTCKDASFDAFQRAACTSGYFLQAAMIKQALDSIGIEMQKFIFYCVEKSELAPCTYYEIDFESLERAENEFNALMVNMAYCIEKNEWPCYQPRILNYPAWAKI